MSTKQVICESQVKEVLEYGPLINKIEDAFGQYSKRSGNIHQPDRCWVTSPHHKGCFASMPVGCHYDDILCNKMITYYPQNADVGKRTHQAIIVAFDGNDGSLRGVVEGETITAMRTAAASAVATKYLVNGQPKTLALIGSGVQGKSHYDALATLFQFEKVKIWSRTKTNADRLAAEVGSNAEVCADVQTAVQDADVIVTATLSSTPVIKAEWVKKGAHINAVGACQPHNTELDPALMTSCPIYVDSISGVMRDSGDQIQSKAPIFAEIGEVINGCREAKCAETTIFNSVGMAVQDAVSVKLVLDNLK